MIGWIFSPLAQMFISGVTWAYGIDYLGKKKYAMAMFFIFLSIGNFAFGMGWI